MCSYFRLVGVFVEDVGFETGLDVEIGLEVVVGRDVVVGLPVEEEPDLAPDVVFCCCARGVVVTFSWEKVSL